MKLWFSIALLLLAWTTGALSAEVRVFPENGLIVASVNPQRGYFDLMIPTVAVRAGPNERVKVEELRLELLKGARTIATRVLDGREMVRTTKDLRSQPVQGLIDVQFAGAKGFAAAFGKRATLADAAALNPDDVLVATEEYFAIDEQPDKLRAVVEAADKSGRRVTYETSTPVILHRSQIRYSFPLRGNWLATSDTGLESHHRFNPPAEFAADFFKVDAEGHDFHGDSSKAENWYAYGQPVLAAAKGEVVNIVADQVQDRVILAQISGETEAQRAARVGKAMEERLFGKWARFPASITGNMVTIRHANGAAVEYSSYGHLKSGSIRVKLHDRVRQGDVIAEVGDTGDTPVVHLHFQVNAGPDAFNDQSLPFQFSDTSWAGATRDPAHFIETGKP